MVGIVGEMKFNKKNKEKDFTIQITEKDVLDNEVTIIN
jgi:hypothetical protein